MKKGATTIIDVLPCLYRIIALRNEKGSYNMEMMYELNYLIIALRNEKGSYN